MNVPSESTNLKVGPVEIAELENLLPLIEECQRANGVFGVERGQNRGFFGRLIAPSQHGALLAAWRGNRAIGYSCVQWELDSIRVREVVRVHELFVTDGEQSGEIGRSLLAAALDLSRIRGAQALVCRITPDYESVLARFTDLGATVTDSVNLELPTS